MKNIFENAKFGDKFLTRDGRIALYIQPIHRAFTYHNLISILRGGTCNQEYLEDGKVLNSCEANDIITRLEKSSLQDIEEPHGECNSNPVNCISSVCPETCSKFIDEKKLDELAINYANKTCGDCYLQDHEYGEWIGYKYGFKAGYCKAKEE